MRSRTVRRPKPRDELGGMDVRVAVAVLDHIIMRHQVSWIRAFLTYGTETRPLGTILRCFVRVQ